jgi:tetratricopeptide (TPR) repeat protein
MVRGHPASPRAARSGNPNPPVIVADDAGSVAKLIELGETLIEQGRAGEAGRPFRAAIAREPDNARALIGLARVVRIAGDREKSARLLNRAAIANRGHTGTRLAVAAAFRDQGEFEPARRHLDKAIAQNPKHTGAWMQVGRLERMRGDRAAALAAFGKAIEIAPQLVQALVERAIEERALGRPFESEQTLALALSIDPAHANALAQAAEHASMTKDEGKALALYERAIAASPDSLKAYLGASRAAAKIGRDTEAFRSLDRAEQLAVPDNTIVARRVYLLRLAGEWPKARAILEASIEACRRDFLLWHQLAALQLVMGDLAALEETLREPPARTPLDIARVHELRGNLAEAKWDFARAATEYRLAVEQNPSDATFALELARAHLLTFDVEAARRDLTRAIRLSASRRVLGGESLNLSQNYLGQILNEFALDPDTVQQLRDADALPSDRRLGVLKDLAQSAPDNIAVAIALLIALRQTSAFARAPQNAQTSPTGRIPQRIVQYWDAARPPAAVAGVMKSWTHAHQDWSYLRFSDKAAREFLRSKLPGATLQAYLRASHPAQKADLFRLAYLFCEGGFYADADDRCLAPLDTIVPPDSELVVYRESYGTIGNNFIGACAGHPVIKQALDVAVESINRGDRDVPWLSTGPGLLSRTLAHFLSEPRGLTGDRTGGLPERLQRVVVLDGSVFARAVAVHCQLSYKNSDKHWINSSFASKKTVPAGATAGAKTYA